MRLLDSVRQRVTHFFDAPLEEVSKVRLADVLQTSLAGVLSADATCTGDLNDET